MSIQDPDFLELRAMSQEFTVAGYEAEEIIIAFALLAFDALLNIPLKPIIFDPFLGRVYNSVFLYWIQLIVLIPGGFLLTIKICKKGKTKGYLWHQFFKMGLKIKKYYHPFEHYPIFAKQEKIND